MLVYVGDYYFILVVRVLISSLYSDKRRFVKKIGIMRFTSLGVSDQSVWCDGLGKDFRFSRLE